MSNITLTKDQRAVLAGLVEERLESEQLDEPGYERYRYEQLLSALIAPSTRSKGLRRIALALTLSR